MVSADRAVIIRLDFQTAIVKVFMRLQNKFIIISAILLMVIVTVICQAKAATGPGGIVGNITGTVTDKADGKPIIGAKASNIPDLRTGSITDENGHFTLNNLPKGCLPGADKLCRNVFNLLTQKVDFTKTYSN